MKRDIKLSEYELFNELSEEWWDENGKFKVLHQIRPIRIKYILDQINHEGIENLDILDVGCGGGLLSESLSRLGANVTGIDFVKNNILVAKKHSKEKRLKINYIHGDIEKIKIKKKYNLIVLFEVLEHLSNWEEFIKSIDSNLKERGVVIISTINRNLISKFAAIFLAENILNWIPKGTHTYEKFIKPDEISKIFKNSNYKFRNLKGLVFNPIEMKWQLSKNTNVNYFCSLHKG